MIGARYQKVYCRIWTSPDFQGWSDDARVLALYLLTCPHRTTEGLFRLPMPFIHYELGWTPDKTAAALEELRATGFVEVDPAVDLVWLVKALKWDGPAGANQVKGAVRALGEVDQSPLRRRYLDRAREDCPELAEAIEADLGWQNDSEPPPPEPSSHSQEAPSKGLAPVDSTPPKPQALSQAQALTHHPSPSHAPPTHPPRSTQEGHGQQSGAEGHPDAVGARVVSLAHKLAGLAKPTPPTRREVSTVVRLLAKGWTEDQLTAPAEEAFARSDIGSPRPWLLQAWENKLDRDPPTSDLRGLGVDEFGAKPIGGPPVAGSRREHPEGCPGGCSDEGWVDGPDGLVRCTGQPIEASA